MCADETPSVQVVINSDTKRLAFLKELEDLERDIETSSDLKIMERHTEVGDLTKFSYICSNKLLLRK